MDYSTDCESTPEPALAPAAYGVWWGTRARLPALHEVVRVVWLGSKYSWLQRGRGGTAAALVWNADRFQKVVWVVKVKVKIQVKGNVG